MVLLNLEAETTDQHEQKETLYNCLIDIGMRFAC